MWRCFRTCVNQNCFWFIFSTYVEVFPKRYGITKRRADFLHVCGGVSNAKVLFVLRGRFSPRMWRCFQTDDVVTGNTEIFSTYVEVFLRYQADSFLDFYFLHVCGGVSEALIQAIETREFSPRMWRCFSILTVRLNENQIFSTYVEVFLRIERLYVAPCDFLHVCGGVSIKRSVLPRSFEFSPRMWRCFP